MDSFNFDELFSEPGEALPLTTVVSTVVGMVTGEATLPEVQRLYRPENLASAFSVAMQMFSGVAQALQTTNPDLPVKSNLYAAASVLIPEDTE